MALEDSNLRLFRLKGQRAQPLPAVEVADMLLEWRW